MMLKRKDLVWIDNKPYIKAKVHMLPTDKKSTLRLHSNKGGLSNNVSLRYNANAWNPMHLYITTDEEIKEDDWMLNTNINNAICKAANSLLVNKGGCFKIIATTDNSLGFAPFGGQDIYTLPQPSNDFINKHIEKYNKGEQIVDVLIEYEILEIPEKSFIINDEQQFITSMQSLIKVDKNNTITIKPVKDGLKELCLKDPELKKEVEALLYKATLDAVDNDFNFWKWIEKNL